MRQHTTHKVISILLLLFVFLVPFYVERGHINSAHQSTYLNAAALSSLTSNAELTSSSSPKTNAVNWSISTGIIDAGSLVKAPVSVTNPVIAAKHTVH